MCCPVKKKTVSSRNLKKTWICGNILDLVKKQQNMYLLFRQSKVNQATYSRFKNFVTYRIRNAKFNYYSRKFDQFKSNTKESWRDINNILGRKKTISDNLFEVNIDDRLVTDPGDVANAFNLHFSTIGQRIGQSVRACANSHGEFLTGNYLSLFMFSYVTSSDVDQTFPSLKNKLTDINTIPNHVLKVISHIISPVLSVIFNNSISQGIYPVS